MTQIYWTLGKYDMVVTIEAPDDESATAFALAIAGAGNVRMQTLRAFSKDEMYGNLGKSAEPTPSYDIRKESFQCHLLTHTATGQELSLAETGVSTLSSQSR